MSDVTSISEQEADTRRLLSIHFDCIIKGYDYGQKEIFNGILSTSKNLPPQWFKLESHLSLEFVKTATEEEIGQTIKEMLHQLEEAINQYKY